MTATRYRPECVSYHPDGEPGEPVSYRIWLTWVVARSQTHRQARCPSCGMLKVWVLR